MNFIRLLLKKIFSYSYSIPLSVPTPRMAYRKSSPDCTVPPWSGLNIITKLDSTTTGGIYHKNKVYIDKNVRIELLSTLYIDAEEELIIDGTITMSASCSNIAPVNIFLVCKKGDIKIGIPAVIGTKHLEWGGLNQLEADGDVSSTANAIAQSPPGVNAGQIKILAPWGTIEIKGKIKGLEGGRGGKAIADPSRSGTLKRGSAVAVSGQGGAGGDVIICRLDSTWIKPEAFVEGGMGGLGGKANAIALGRKDAWAVGGPGNEGGDVVFLGEDPNTGIIIEGTIYAGAGGDSGYASSLGGNDDGRGGKATSESKDAGGGGTVIFKSCKVRPPYSAPGSGGGGHGEKVESQGGKGEDVPPIPPLPFPLSAILVKSKLYKGWAGGDAKSNGGNGGIPGSEPIIPLDTGGTDKGFQSPGGWGGDAEATQGSGGKGTPGGNTGSAEALGGTDYKGGGAFPKNLKPTQPKKKTYGPGAKGKKIVSLG